MKPPQHLRLPTRRWFAEVSGRYSFESHHFRLLQLAGEAWDRGQTAREAIADHGLTYLDRYGNPRPRPEVAIERDSRIGFARLIRELGIDDAEEPKETGGMQPRRSNDRHWQPPNPWED